MDDCPYPFAQMSSLLPDFLPLQIAMFQGLASAIPSGWVLCDGNNGTPDLRNLFSRAAGGSVNPDDTQVDPNHTHPFTAVPHDHNIAATGPTAGGTGFDITTAEASASGTTDNGQALPPFFGLFYIMKV